MDMNSLLKPLRKNLEVMFYSVKVKVGESVRKAVAVSVIQQHCQGMDTQ